MKFEIRSGLNQAGNPALHFSSAAYDAFIESCRAIRLAVQTGRTLTIKDVAQLAPLVLLADHPKTNEGPFGKVGQNARPGEDLQLPPVAKLSHQ